MSITDLIQSADYLIDADGHKKAVQIDLSAWEEIVSILETLPADSAADLADEQEWDKAFARSPDMLTRLADEARIERAAGRAKLLDPDLL